MKRALVVLLIVVAVLAAGAAFFIHAQRDHQRAAIELLLKGDEAGAKPHLDALRRRTVLFPAVPKHEVARQFFARGAYAAWLTYDEAVRERTASADVILDRAAALASTGRISAAVKLFAAVNPAKVDPKLYATMRDAIAARASGRIPYVFDRDGRSLAVYDLTHASVVATDRDFQPLIDALVAPHVDRLGTAKTLDTTLDARTQRAAIAALGAYRGTLVAIDPRTNEILAIASTNGATLDHQYEPGSVVKVLTGLSAIDSGIAVPFPYQCTGSLDIDGTRFGDWMPNGHGTLETIDEALAVSCNIVFADLGLRLGDERIRTFMTKAGFDGQTDTGIAPLPLGRLVPPIATRNDTAHLAIGLEHETVTPLHLAMLASMMANRGVLTSPRLLRTRRTILGDVAFRAPAPASTRIASERAAATMTHAMEAVVTDPRGTGRRAFVDGIPIAMKTGTAGTREKGYDALVMAFAPAQSPTIAFAIIAENAGHAEVAGAQIAHDFVTAMFSGAAAVPAAARSGSTGTLSATAPAPPAPH
ncbi:MAG: penicillin-binding protein transpeptidase [Acidobacteria bacterium]|nr:penicillin-binding protein transpeptidase [Acidobacteriota bacterium]